MAIEHFDGFDGYPVSALTTEFAYTTGGTGTTTFAAAGRFGTNCLRLSDWDRQVALVNLPSVATRWVHVAFTCPTVAPNATKAIIQFIDTATIQMDLRITTGNVLFMTRNGTQVGSNGPTLVAGSNYHLAFGGTIADSGGVFQLYVNNDLAINFTGDTQNTTNASSNAIVLSSTATNTAQTINIDFDDLIIADERLNDAHVASLLPTGNGSDSDWVGSDGNSVDNYALVNEVTPDEDATYVTAVGTGARDLYAYGNTAVGTSVLAVEIHTRARKTDVGTATLKAAAKVGSSVAYAADINPGTTYTTYHHRMDTKPGGGSWTRTDLDNAEFGVEVVA